MPAESDLEKARLLFKQGNRPEAREVLIKAVRTDPRNPDLWFGLSFCVDDPEQKKDCLEKVLRLSPNHPKARGLLEQFLIGEENLQVTPQDLTGGIKPVMPAVTKESGVTDWVAQQDLKSHKPDKQKDELLINELEEAEADLPTTKKAGESTHLMANKWRRIGIVSGISLIIVLIAIMVLFQLNKTIYHNMNLVIPLFCGFIIVFIFTWVIVNKFIDRWRDYRHGAIAEEFVGKILENLSQDYLVLNDIQLGYGNVDHFVLGKNGCMYMIETKSHRGKVSIEGDNVRVNNKPTEKDFIKQTKRNAFNIRDEIESILGVSLGVTPVLVFTNASVPYTPNNTGVIILNKRTLLKFILSGKEQQNREVIWKKRGLIQEFLYRPRW